MFNIIITFALSTLLFGELYILKKLEKIEQNIGVKKGKK